MRRVNTVSRPGTLRPRCHEATLEALERLGGQGSRREIVRLAEQIARFTPEERALPAPDAARQKYSRLIDHQLSWTLTHLKREGVIETHRWGHWRLVRPAEEEGATPVAEILAMAGAPPTVIDARASVRGGSLLRRALRLVR